MTNFFQPQFLLLLIATIFIIHVCSTLSLNYNEVGEEDSQRLPKWHKYMRNALSYPRGDVQIVQLMKKIYISGGLNQH